MKTTLKITSLLVCLFFLSTGVGLARPGMNQAPMINPMWWHNQELSTKLNITKEQQAKLEEHLQATHPHMIDLKADVQKALFALEGALGENLDEQKVEKTQQNFLKAQNAMMKARIETLVSTRKILTFEQFRNLRNENRKHRRGKKDIRKGTRQRFETREN